MIIKEKFEVSLRKDVTCKKGSLVLGMLDGADAIIPVPVKLVVGKDQKVGKYPVYLEEEGIENMVGKIQYIKAGDGTVLDDNDILNLLSEEYKIDILRKEGNEMFGEFSLLKDEATSATHSGVGEMENKIKDLSETLVASGIVPQDEIDERIKYMFDNSVDPYLIYRVLKGYRKYDKPCHKPSCLYVDPYLATSKKQKIEGIIAEGLRAACSRHAIICEGEKSVGKNVYLETIAWLLGMPLFLITFSRQMSPSSIYGEKSTDNSAAQALSKFDPDILVKKEAVEEKRRFMMNLCVRKGMSAEETESLIQENLTSEEKDILKKAAEFEIAKAKSASVNIIIDSSELYDWLTMGGLMVFNEQNMAEANFFASFTNQLLDGTGFLFIPGRGEVKINKDCVLFGTQNADYAGTETTNEATVSRFGCLYFKQPESIKAQLQASVAAALKKDGFENNLDSKYFNEAEKYYKQCRSAVRQGTVSNAVLNIRGFVRALTAVAESDGYARLSRQVQIHVIDTTPTDERGALTTILNSIITL